MSHEVLITRRQSIFDFFANPGRGGPQHPNQPAPASTDLLRPASAWICKKIKNALSSGYQDLMGHLILTTSPWSVLTWITLMFNDYPTIWYYPTWFFKEQNISGNKFFVQNLAQNMLAHTALDLLVALPHEVHYFLRRPKHFVKSSPYFCPM